MPNFNDNVEDDKNQTLYERMGGEEIVPYLTAEFCDEWMEDPDVQHFFKNCSKEMLKGHLIKFFRTAFGKKEDQPDPAVYISYLLETHARLFRENGLNGSHFDKVMECFERGLRIFEVNEDAIKDIIGAMLPMRGLFEYGAAVAAKEKLMTPKELKKLPKASAKTLGTDTPATLPQYPPFKSPAWLPEALGNKDNPSIIRAWASELLDYFGADNDAEIADTILDMPYLKSYEYAAAFLTLAFLPAEQLEGKDRSRAMKMVLYPRGRKEAALSRKLFDKMIVHFGKVCISRQMSKKATDNAITSLRAYRQSFALETHIVGGAKTPHFMQPLQHAKSIAVAAAFDIEELPAVEAGKPKRRESFTERTVSSGSFKSPSAKKENIINRLFRRRKSSDNLGGVYW